MSLLQHQTGHSSCFASGAAEVAREEADEFQSSVAPQSPLWWAPSEDESDPANVPTCSLYERGEEGEEEDHHAEDDEELEHEEEPGTSYYGEDSSSSSSPEDDHGTAFDSHLPEEVPKTQRRSISAQLTALLAIKEALDTNGVLNWSEERGLGAAYCRGAFEGVACDPYANVVAIHTLGKSLGGTLPAASALQMLQSLSTVDIAHANLTGTLPPEYGQLSELQSLTIAFNPALTGPLPSEWAGMRSLKKLYLM